MKLERPRGERWTLGAALLVLILLFAGREDLIPVRALVWHASALMWWIAVAAACLGQGLLFFRLAGGLKLGLAPCLTLAAAFGLGLGGLSLEVFLLGVLGFLTTPALTVLLLMVLATSLLAGRRSMWGLLLGVFEEAREAGRDAAIPLVVILLAAAMLLPLVLVPVRAFDALAYHLEVPLRYLQAGAVVDLTENLYSYAPLMTQMLYGLAMGIQGTDLAGLLYYLFFLLTLWIVWRGGAELFGHAGAAWASAILALTPVFILEVPQAGADWSMTFYTVAVVLLLAQGKREPHRMVVAGLLAGLAAGCRHQALGFAVVIPALAGLVADVADRRPGTFRTWSVFTGTAVLAASPWYLKNALQTGDPIYPLFTSLLGRLPYSVSFVEGLTGPRPLSLLWSWALVPYQAVFDPMSLSMTASLGVLPLALLPLLYLSPRGGKGRRFLLIWLVLSFAAWHLTFRTFRYLMPVVTVSFLWLGAGVAAALKGKKPESMVLKAALCLALAVNAGVFVGLTDYVNRSVGAALGTKSPQRYLEETYEVYPSIDFLNRLETPPGKVLFLGEMRGFYSRFPREVPSHNAPNRLLELVRGGVAPAGIRDRLKAAGITHILVNPAEWRRMAYANRSAPLWQLDPSQTELLEAFFRDRTRQVFTRNGIAVLEIAHE